MPSWEVREDEAGVLDEVICFEPANVHLERMDECAWWLGITFEDGTEIHVNVGAVRQSTVKSFATYWVESPDQDQPIRSGRTKVVPRGEAGSLGKGEFSC